MSYAILIHECGGVRFTKAGWWPASCKKCGARLIDTSERNHLVWQEQWFDITTTVTVVGPTS